MAEMVFVLIARGSTEIGTNIRNTAWHKVSNLRTKYFDFTEVGRLNLHPVDDIYSV